MESSRRDLFIDMVVDWFIFKHNQITLSPCSTFLPTTVVGLPKTSFKFYCEPLMHSTVLRTLSNGGLPSY